MIEPRGPAAGAERTAHARRRGMAAYAVSAHGRGDRDNRSAF